MRYIHIMLTGVFLSALISSGAIAQQAPGKQGIDPNYPTVIANMNIWGLYTRYQIMLEEIMLSISKGNAGLLTHDAGRWGTYIRGLRGEAAYWQSQAFLDLPVTHGRDWELSDPLDLTCDFKDNSAVCQLMALIINARDELALSASAELPMHFYAQDLTRQESYWQAMEGYIAYLLSAQPLDEPVTAAEERLGLNPGWSVPEQ